MANQEFQAYINSRTEDTAPDIANDFLPIYDASATTTKKVTPTSLRTAMFASGSIDGGEMTSFELPNSAAPTVDADGEIAVDTSVADFSHGIVKVFAGEELALVALPIAQLTTPTNGHVIKYNATTDEFELGAAAGGIGGSTGATDNAILRADGTGGATVQSSAVTIDDSGNLAASNAVVAAFRLDCDFVAPGGGVRSYQTGDSIQFPAAGVIQLQASGGSGCSFEVEEMTAPSSPAANHARIYAEDNGAGKTRLMALFGSGAAQQIAIEP